MVRIGLEEAYRITMCHRKGNDMIRLTNNVLAACAAFVLSLASIGAIPQAEAAAPAPIATVELA